MKKTLIFSSFCLLIVIIWGCNHKKIASQKDISQKDTIISQSNEIINGHLLTRFDTFNIRILLQKKEDETNATIIVENDTFAPTEKDYGQNYLRLPLVEQAECVEFFAKYSSNFEYWLDSINQAYLLEDVSFIPNPIKIAPNMLKLLVNEAIVKEDWKQMPLLFYHFYKSNMSHGAISVKTYCQNIDNDAAKEYIILLCSDLDRENLLTIIDKFPDNQYYITATVSLYTRYEGMDKVVILPRSQNIILHTSAGGSGSYSEDLSFFRYEKRKLYNCLNISKENAEHYREVEQERFTKYKELSKDSLRLDYGFSLVNIMSNDAFYYLKKVKSYSLLTYNSKSHKYESYFNEIPLSSIVEGPDFVKYYYPKLKRLSQKLKKERSIYADDLIEYLERRKYDAH